MLLRKPQRRHAQKKSSWGGSLGTGSAVRKLEENSLKRENAKQLFENSSLSNREIATEIGVSEKSVRNWSADGNWQRMSADQSAGVRNCGPAAPPPVPTVNRSAAEIAKDFCSTIDVLRADLDTVIRNLNLIREIAESDLDGSGDKAIAARKRLLAKVLELPTLVKSANDLAAALSRLKDVGPGKKEQRQSDAEQSASSGRFAAPAPPPRLMQ